MKMDMLRFVGGTSVDFPIIGAEASGPFVLMGADGLGPPEVTVRLARTVLEKAIYQGKHPNPRQIIATVGLQPNWDVGQTPEELRTILYGLLTPRYSQMVRCEIVSNGIVKAFAQGQISKMEAAIFTKDPAVQITLNCDYGYLLSPTPVVEQPAQTTVGGIRGFTIDNDGTAPSGFKAGFVLMGNVGTSLVLADANPLGQKFQIDGTNWLAGDRFVIDTRPGTRGVWRGAGGGALVSILSGVNASVSEWMTLYHGANDFTLNTAAFDWDLAYKFTHQPAYWGV